MTLSRKFAQCLAQAGASCLASLWQVVGGAQCKGSRAVPCPILDWTPCFFLLMGRATASLGVGLGLAAFWEPSEGSFPESENDFLVHAPFSPWDSRASSLSRVQGALGPGGFWDLRSSRP